MKKMKIDNRGFAPLGAIIAGLVALGLIGGGAVYQYSKKNEIKVQANTTIQQRAGQGMRMGHGSDFKPDYNTELSKYAMGELSSEELEDLTYMREEEKLARDVYLTLYDKWGAQTFSNIAKSEERHTLAIKALLDRYGMQDPVIDDTVGVFQNETLAGLYNDLVAQGSNSLEDAFKVGATIEDLDIKDLQDALARTDNEDITAVYNNLMRGSRNHLRSFYRELQNLGADYSAQYITQAELEEIVNSDMERGAGHGHGGAGQGNAQHSHSQGQRTQEQGRGQGMSQGQGHGQGQGMGQGRGMHGQGQGVGQGRGMWQNQ